MEKSFVSACGFQPVTETENGAKAYHDTGSALVTQFGMVSKYRGRELLEVFGDQEKVWEENNLYGLRFPFYLRLISRTTNLTFGKTNKMQKGQGLRDESFKRLLWIAKNHRDVFFKNIRLIPYFGSWKDLFTLLWYDEQYHTNCFTDEDKKLFYYIIEMGLSHDDEKNLVKKFMPRIRANKKLKTDRARALNNIAKGIASYLHLSYGEYNKLKAGGTGHNFQKILCEKRYDDLDWGKIPGRALYKLTNGKFLSNHNLEQVYLDWIISQKSAKFTGYPYELVRKVRDLGITLSKKSLASQVSILTADAQFKHLIEQAKADNRINENVLVCLDTSGSMNQSVDGLKKITCLDIAISLALFFSELNTGEFHKTVMMFDNVVTPYKVVGNSLHEQIEHLPRVGSGGTNFMGVAQELIKIHRYNPTVPLETYPTTILVVSDMQFNSVPYYYNGDDKKTNYEATVASLKSEFPADWVDNLKFIWWNCAGRKQTFESDAFKPGSIIASGFDGNLINLIMGMEPKVNKVTGEKTLPTAEDIVKNALEQEIFEYVNFGGEE